MARGGHPQRWVWLSGSSVVVAAVLVWSAWIRPDIAAALLILGGPFIVLEAWRPLRRQPAAFRRAGAATDAVSFVVNEVLAGLGLAAVLVVALPILHLVVPPSIPGMVSAQPAWARWLEAFTISELAGYWGHRASHEIPILWRFHRVHHSAPELDWLAPNRRHPIDQTVALLSTSLPVLALGFTVSTVATHFALKRIQGLLVHSNINIRLRPLQRIVVTPMFHHWHHSADPGTWNKNYAGSLPVVDWLFGTMYLPGRWPSSYGCDGDVPDVGYLARILSPWRSSPTAGPAEASVRDHERRG